MIEEFKFNMCIQTTESDYADHEIYYRIYANDQLITERSYPCISLTQSVMEVFFLKPNDTIPKADVGNSSILTFFAKHADKSRYYYKIVLENCTEKKISCNAITVNNIKLNPNSTSSKSTSHIPGMGLCEVLVKNEWYHITSENVAILLKVQIK